MKLKESSSLRTSTNELNNKLTTEKSNTDDVIPKPNPKIEQNYTRQQSNYYHLKNLTIQHGRKSMSRNRNKSWTTNKEKLQVYF